MSIYCVYLTSYSGNKLPSFYIGSSSVNKVNSGYRGSVRSKRYITLWKYELKHNPHLFKTIIISTHLDRKDALLKEYKLQKTLNVVKNPLYINQALACANGFFGMDNSKENHHLYGTGHTKEACLNISKNHADCSGNNNSRARLIQITTNTGEIIICNGNFKEVCRSLNIPWQTIHQRHLKGIIPTTGKCVGYSAKYLD